MAEFLVEVYVAPDDSRAAREIGRAVRESAGCGVRCVRRILVPEDETCFLLYEGPSAEAVAAAVRRAGLTPDHVSAATSRPTHRNSSRHRKAPPMTITTNHTASHTELRDKQHQVWSSGDYNKIAAITVPLSEALVEHVGIGPDDRVLDVATGTGHAALAAARRSADVTGTDYVPGLLDIARRRAAAEDLTVKFVEADAESMPCEDGEYDVVLSAIGVMFSADHRLAAQELVRVCRPGGTIAVASWTPLGFIGQLLATVGKHVTPPAGAQPPPRWGIEETVAELLGDQVTDVASTTRTVTQRFTDAEQFADLFLTYYGPTYSAAKRLSDAGRAALRADMVELARSFDRGEGSGLVFDWEYRIVTARRRA